MSLARITPNQVKQIYGLDVKDEACEVSIDTAKIYVDKIAAGALSDAILRLIWLYLAAHFYSLSYPRPTSESGGGISQSWREPNPGTGLKSTVFGQQAVMLDTTATLEQDTGTPFIFETLLAPE